MLRRLAALSAALLMAAACTAGGDGRPPAVPSGGDVPGTIVVAGGRDVTGKNGIRQQLIDAWNKEQRRTGSDYRARLVELPGSADEQRSQLLGALQSGSAAYDVVNLDVTWVPEFAAAGLIRRLPGKLVDEDVIESVAGTARWDGDVYAVPFNSDVGLLYYRRDYLERAGVRRVDLTSWSAVRHLVETLDSRLDEDAYDKGWTTQLAAYEGRTVNAVEAFASAVEDFSLVDGEGRYTGTVEDLTDGIEELGRRTGRPYTLADAVQSDEAASLSDFAEGRTAFLRHWPSVYPALHRTFTEEQLGVAPLPGRAVLGGQNLAVTSSSPRARSATDLITFLTGQESERCLLEAGFAATRVSAYEGGERCTTATVPSAPASPSASGDGEGADPVPRDAAGRPAYARKILLEALRKAVQRPRTPLYGAFTQTFTAQLDPLLGDDPPDAEELAARLDRALREALSG
ncbi:extracellular solute-binding protein [Streptomyces sp. NPDC029526]|uniref:extracellular solute-binding protein n=1 Tax=Streptomyces sp. NPDC029526 TaxID=3155728 RepID=UPI0033D25927